MMAMAKRQVRAQSRKEAKKSWQDLSRRQRRSFGLIAAVQWWLTAWALTDLIRREPAQVNGRKIWWGLASFINFAGPICYFLFGRKR